MHNSRLHLIQITVNIYNQNYLCLLNYRTWPKWNLLANEQWYWTQFYKTFCKKKQLWVFMKVRQCLNPSWQRKVFVSSQWKQKIRSIATAILKCLSDASKSRIIRKKNILDKISMVRRWNKSKLWVLCFRFCVFKYTTWCTLLACTTLYLLLGGLESNCVILLVVSNLELR